jgi:AraC-like DNA-binding protein
MLARCNPGTPGNGTVVDPPDSGGEAGLWRAAGAGWRQLFGSFRSQGLSFEWHDFEAEAALDWAGSFHPGSLEICLNVAGEGNVRCQRRELQFPAMSGGFYARGPDPLEASRAGGQRHQFLTVELSPGFLARQLAGHEARLHPLVQAVVAGGARRSGLGDALPLSTAQHQLLLSLRNPPVLAAAQALWYQSKAAELMAQFFYQPADEELFCSRQHRLARERTGRVLELLRSRLADPPSLEELARTVSCSAFYLSRTFSREMGLTIPQYLQRLRLERAAELLKAGQLNVTEVAMEVGYSSLSHFSLAFRQAFGSCPGLYPVTIPTPLATTHRKA